MKFITLRELREHPRRVRTTLAGEDLVVTANGKPLGILVGVDEENLAEVLDALRRVRALRAVTRMRRRAAEEGLDRMPPQAIDAEIRESRKERRTP